MAPQVGRFAIRFVAAQACPMIDKRAGGQVIRRRGRPHASMGRPQELAYWMNTICTTLYGCRALYEVNNG